MAPTISPTLLRLFAKYGRWYVARSFDAVRISGELPKFSADEPIVIYLNHPSWWDPMLCLLLSQHYWPDRNHFAPIDSAALDKYRFFRKLGFFGVSRDLQGAKVFLSTSLEILKEPGSMLWISGEGQFCDPRTRPPMLLPGVPHLARHLERGTFVPLAIEYPFWDERFPQALCRMGKRIDIATQPKMNIGEWTAKLQEAMRITQDALAIDAMTRRPEAFEILTRGSAGVGFFYDTWRKLRAAMNGEDFSAQHGIEKR